MNKKLKIAQSGDAAFSGSGKLSDYKEDGSWMMNQIEKGYDKVERGVTIDKSTGNIVFSNCHKRKNKSNNGTVFSNAHEADGDLIDSILVQETAKKVASKIVTASEDIKIIKYFNILQENEDSVTVALKLCLFGELDGSSITDLNLVKEFLLNRYYSDLKSLYSYYDMTVEYMGDVCIDFNKNCVRLQALINVNTDRDDLYYSLISDCFNYQAAGSQEIF